MSVDLELAAPETVYRVLSEDGSELVADPPDIPDADLVAVMAEMVKARVANGRFFALQRQGRAGTYAPIEGQEATVVGAVAALDPARDWVLPQYRECVALGRYGPEVMRTYALYQRGHPGRWPLPGADPRLPHPDLPGGPDPPRRRPGLGDAAEGRSRRGLRVLRRRRQLGGRLLRGRELRRRAGSAGAVPLRQQRLGDLDAAGGARRRRRASPPRRPPSASPASGSTATTPWPCSTSWRPPGSGRWPGAGRP